MRSTHTADLFVTICNDVFRISREWTVDMRGGYYGRSAKTETLKRRFVYCDQCYRNLYLRTMCHRQIAARRADDDVVRSPETISSGSYPHLCYLYFRTMDSCKRRTTSHVIQSGERTSAKIQRIWARSIHCDPIGRHVQCTSMPSLNL